MSDMNKDNGEAGAPISGSAPSRRLARAAEYMEVFNGDAAATMARGLAKLSPDLKRLIIEFGYGDIYSRPGLDPRAREIATIAALTVMGSASSQLAAHVAAGLHVGLSRTEISETIIQMALYAGFPAALNGMKIANKVFDGKFSVDANDETREP